jgi:hypothetical protein
MLDSCFTFRGLHGVMSQKIEVFITTAARTSNPTPLITIIDSYVTVAY